MRRILFFFLSLLALVLAACSGNKVETTSPQIGTPASATTDGANPLERVDQQGAVTVTVIPLNLSNPGETLDFDVSFETHSVELGMNFAESSTLTTDTGITVSSATWDGSSGGHHVTGKLSFPTSQDGKLILEGAKTLTLVIQNVDAEKRTFSWEMMK